jgi:hypothetical protein
MAVSKDLNATDEIDKLIAKTTDWRGKTLASVRKAFLDADPEVIEEWKWMGSPVWSCDGIIAVGNAHKNHVKVTFANGAHVADPDKIFNNGLGGNKWRSIDFFEGDKVNGPGLKKLVQAAIAYNKSKAKKKPPTPASKVKKKAPAAPRKAKMKASVPARAKKAVKRK